MPDGLKTVTLYDNLFEAPSDTGEYELQTFIDDIVYEGMVTEKLKIFEVMNNEAEVVKITSVEKDPDFILKLFPNPTSSHATISFQSIHNLGQIQLIDLQGREFWRTDILEQKITLPISSLKPATYMLLVYDNHKRIIERVRVIIQK